MNTLYEKFRKPSHEINTMLTVIKMGINSINKIIELDKLNNNDPLLINDLKKGRLNMILKNMKISSDKIQIELDKIILLAQSK